VEIHAGGGALPHSRCDQNPNVTQGAIVENKRLGVALATIQSAQIARAVSSGGRNSSTKDPQRVSSIRGFVEGDRSVHERRR
jgi:hypothetical protein